MVTGLSGSGKSTLAFDILFAEGQRRFLDSMSAYARQFVEQLERPDVDHVAGIPPSVAIEQRLTQGGGKSTVATLTEVYHFLRLLFAKLGVQYCPRCEHPGHETEHRGDSQTGAGNYRAHARDADGATGKSAKGISQRSRGLGETRRLPASDSSTEKDDVDEFPIA